MNELSHLLRQQQLS